MHFTLYGVTQPSLDKIDEGAAPAKGGGFVFGMTSDETVSDDCR